MKSFTLILPIALAWSLLRIAPGPAQAPVEASPLNTVLKKMDTAAAGFRNLQAEFEWDSYEKVIDEIDEYQTGTIYYRRAGKEIEMMADVKKAGSDPQKLKPEPKFVLFSKGKVKMYQPKTDQVTEFDLGKNRADFESYVVLGFGGSGQDLLKSLRRALMWARTRSTASPRRSCSWFPSPRRSATRTSRFFFGSILIEGSRCSSNSLNAAGRLPAGEVL